MQALAPGSKVGILGGGQLGRMLAMAAAQLGFKCHIYEPAPNSPAFSVCAARTCAPYDDFQSLESFAQNVDVVTFEFENVPIVTAQFIAQHARLAPGLRALSVSQERLLEKEFLCQLGLKVAQFAAVDDQESLLAGLEKIGRPTLLKTRRLGYDGKGQVSIDEFCDPEQAWAQIGKVPALLEALVSFTQEVSVIAARNSQGEMAFYDPPSNYHEKNILRESRVPAALSQETVLALFTMTEQIATALDYTGVLAVEFFIGSHEEITINEIAPRVHNSGHWTLDACNFSQFEQHIRAIAGWPLGNIRRHCDVISRNILGYEAEQWLAIAADPDHILHFYGKEQMVTGRKMGHINCLKPRQS